MRINFRIRSSYEDRQINWYTFHSFTTEKITASEASELADRFEVSKRTINRDIENLCKAGIPIQTAQGSGGGIQIMDGYKMDRTLLTTKEMQMIMAGLRSLDSISGSNYYGQLMGKIKHGSSHFTGGKDSFLVMFPCRIYQQIRYFPE